MSTGVIFILGKGVTPILAYGVKSTWPQGSSAPGFSNVHAILNVKVSAIGISILAVILLSNLNYLVSLGISVLV